eukprot:PRCOL_00007023-RA
MRAHASRCELPARDPPCLHDGRRNGALALACNNGTYSRVEAHLQGPPHAAHISVARYATSRLRLLVL